MSLHSFELRNFWFIFTCKETKKQTAKLFVILCVSNKETNLNITRRRKLNSTHDS